mgnify:CR=1 FL=1
MGLDMFLNGEKYFWSNDSDKTIKEDVLDGKSKELRVGYWRKHPDRHGFIVNEFANGEDNCQRIDLDTGDIEKIIKAVKEKTLPHTTGFFFGSSDWWDTEENLSLTIKQLEGALAWMSTEEKGVSRSVFYKASW